MTRDRVVAAWRPDAARFPAEVVGTELDGWKGERWLDVRRLDVLQPILAERFDMCRRKGFDGVEADNVDGYTQDSGFPLTADDQLRFNRFLAAVSQAVVATNHTGFTGSASPSRARRSSTSQAARAHGGHSKSPYSTSV